MSQNGDYETANPNDVLLSFINLTITTYMNNTSIPQYLLLFNLHIYARSTAYVSFASFAAQYLSHSRSFLPAVLLISCYIVCLFVKSFSLSHVFIPVLKLCFTFDFLMDRCTVHKYTVHKYFVSFLSVFFNVFFSLYIILLSIYFVSLPLISFPFPPLS